MKNYLLAFFVFYSLPLLAQPQKVWLDADTGNETDDVYAIARLLAEPSVEVVGLSSAHFNNADLVAFEKWNQYPTKGIKTVEISQQLNADILKTMGKGTIAHPIGADRQIGRAWGGHEPRKSPASDGIIAAVKRLRPGEKLDVLCIGALTNIASAIITDPGIIPAIRCFAMGAKYNETKKAWSKNEFNIRGDLNAFDYLLDCPNLDLTIIPVEACLPYRFDRDVVYSALNDQIPIHKMMKDRWKETNPDDKVRILWDLALVQVYLHPEWSIIKEVATPPENTQRMVKVFAKIDVKAMTADFWKSMDSIKK